VTRAARELGPSVASRRPASRAAKAPYAERFEPLPGRVDRALSATWGWLEPRLLSHWRVNRLARFAEGVEEVAPRFRDLTDRALRDAADDVRRRTLRGLGNATLTTEVFALVREASRRHLGLQHHREQLIGGAVMLDGALAEMATGEGKTITALLPAAAFALAGRPVHVVTINDYLVQRDTEQLRPVYEALGLSVGAVIHGQDQEARHAAYGSDVTYCSNKDIVFDYLRDRRTVGVRRARMQRLMDDVLEEPGRSGRDDRAGRLLLRGLHVAIVDEADSVLIDEARTPLILSGGQGTADEDTAARHMAALDFARSLRRGGEFVLRLADRDLHLTPAGQQRLHAWSADRAGLWQVRRAREEMVEQALRALYMYHPGVHYIVNDGQVQIVDEYTGRIMPDRSWERGLHQLIEAKEGCVLTGQRHTLARITYQRFFRRYWHLCGMTGTAAEAAGELRSVYGLRAIRVPTHHPSRRRDLGVKIVPDAETRWQTVAERARQIAGEGRAVLIGTRSVEASEQIADRLLRVGSGVAVLNARQDRGEATVVARAGQPGCITVATNMAGRGTDIRLSQEVRAAGGLHVILTEFHESRRVDRQLFGRCGRQGDPGSHEAVVSLEDELLVRYLGRSPWRCLAKLATARSLSPLATPAAWMLRSGAQAWAERRNANIRQDTLHLDEHLDRVLSFSNRSE